MATTPRKPVPPRAKAAPPPKPVAKPRVARRPAIAKAVVAEPIAVEAPKPIPVIIAEPVAPPAPAKLTLISSTPVPIAGKKLDSAAMMKGYEDFTAFGKDNFDALVKANALFAKGLEDFGKEVLGIAQAHMEEAAKLAKAMLQAKTLHEVVEMHTELTKASLEKLIAESSMLSELGMKVTNEAMAPINARVTIAVEKMRKLSAA